MELNAHECGMLDTLLKAFDDNNTLDAQQMRTLFPGQDSLLTEMVQVLISWKLVTPFGQDAVSGLPLLLHREKHALYFLENGGFSGSIEDKTSITTLEAERLHEREQRIHQLEGKIKDLNQQHYVLWFFLALAIVFIVGLFLLHDWFHVI
jgi:hypothetical protein